MSFMTFLVFSSLLLCVLLSLYVLKNEDNLLHLNSHLLKSNASNQMNVNEFSHNELKIDQRDDGSVILFVYTVIIIGIVFPNINQIDWL
jgi:anaerobic C4-dicarboxylate transporter